MESGGRGNYAPWGLLDWLHGTSAGRDVVEDVRGEVEKQDVNETVGRTLRSGRDRVKGLNDRRKGRK